MAYQGNNYWADILYTANTDTTPPVMTGRTPSSDAVDVDPAGTITASFDEPIDLTNTQVTVRDPGGASTATSPRPRARGRSPHSKPDVPVLAVQRCHCPRCHRS